MRGGVQVARGLAKEPSGLKPGAKPPYEARPPQLTGIPRRYISRYLKEASSWHFTYIGPCPKAGVNSLLIWSPSFF